MKRKTYLATVPVLGLAFALGFTLSATPGHGYVSIPAAALQPVQDGYDFQRGGYYLINLDNNSDSWYAPVQLPHGAEVTKLTYYWMDASTPDDGWCQLWAKYPTGGSFKMAEAWTSGDTIAVLSSEDTIIDYATVDNSQATYFLQFSVPNVNVQPHVVIIEYTYQTSLPAILR